MNRITIKERYPTAFILAEMYKYNSLPFGLLKWKNIDIEDIEEPVWSVCEELVSNPTNWKPASAVHIKHKEKDICVKVNIEGCEKAYLGKSSSTSYIDLTSSESKLLWYAYLVCEGKNMKLEAKEKELDKANLRQEICDMFEEDYDER